MSKEKDIHGLIEAYLEGELSEEEKLDFEKRLTTDKELALAWQLNQEVDKTFQNPRSLEMEEMLFAIGNEFANDNNQSQVTTKPKARIRPLYLLAMVASFALIFSLIWWQFGPVSTSDSQQLFAQYYQPYTVSTSIRSGNKNIQTLLEEGVKVYQNGDYEKATELLLALTQRDEMNIEDALITEFYKGLAYLGNEEWSKAKSTLEEVIEVEGHSYMQQSYWYLAMIALKKEDVESTKIYLSKVIAISPEGKYGSQATKLLKELGLNIQF